MFYLANRVFFIVFEPSNSTRSGELRRDGLNSFVLAQFSGVFNIQSIPKLTLIVFIIWF